MKYPESKFKFVDRGFKDTLVLIPGWATDYRIFSSLDLKFNYLQALKFCPLNFNDELAKSISNNSLNKVSLFGWSLGSFLAQDFALNNQARVDRLILLSIRAKYESSLLETIKQQLLKNKKVFLYKFYRDCFPKDDRESWLWFKNNLLKDYSSSLEFDGLVAGLDYLAGAQINPGFLAKFRKLKIYHGEDDQIAPFKEACEVRKKLPLAEFISMPGTGHIPFLSKYFTDVLE